jgi:hypothetical protein
MDGGGCVMTLSREDVREQLRATVDQRITVAQFEEWLVVRSWNLHLSDTPDEVQQLVHAIDRDLAALTDEPRLSALRRHLYRLDAPVLTVVDWTHGQSLDAQSLQVSESVSVAARAWEPSVGSRGTVIKFEAPRPPVPVTA